MLNLEKGCEPASMPVDFICAGVSQPGREQAWRCLRRQAPSSLWPLGAAGVQIPLPALFSNQPTQPITQAQTTSEATTAMAIINSTEIIGEIAFTFLRILRKIILESSSFLRRLSGACLKRYVTMFHMNSYKTNNETLLTRADTNSNCNKSFEKTIIIALCCG